jgi:glycosidase
MLDASRRPANLECLLLAIALAWPTAAAANEIAADAPPPATSRAALHVPSPDWRDQIIYFLMTDRFDDGDPSNNDQHAGEFDAGDSAKYNGGDLRGIERRLDYIRELGATAVWITPPVGNLWWDSVANYGGYHGYWAENFMSVDAHVGALRDYQQLSKSIHGAGMHLVQDIVLNHTGSYFDYEGGWDKDDPLAHFKLTPDSRGRTAPSQWPFNMNDVRDDQQRAAAIYHWTPRVNDYNDPVQVLDHQMSGLDDLNSENSLVREALRKSYGYWIREAGVDAFRIDTAFYVPPDALADFLYSNDKKYPGVLAQAARTGRSKFHVFGEGFAIDKAYADKQARRIDSLMHRSDGSPLLSGMLNFPLYASIGDVFARGRPTAEMSYRIESMMRVHQRPELMATFLDNHDVDRFLAGGSEAGLKQGLLLMMTLPGIPTIYYGTEQGFTTQRAAMFKAGSGSGGVDHFDQSAPLYRYIQRVTALRRAHRVFSRGRPSILKDNAAAPGVLAYQMSQPDSSAIVVFNSADNEVLLDNLETGLDAGVVLSGVFDIDGRAHDLVTGEGGRISMKLPARSGGAWLVTTRRAAIAQSLAQIRLDDSLAAVVTGDFKISGEASGVRQFKLVVDGDLASAQTITVDSTGRWSAMVDTGNMIDPAIRHSVVAWAESPAAASISRNFSVARRWTELVDIADPNGDDKGPAQRYSYPSDTSWRAHRQLDIQRVRVAAAGGAMKISLRMNEISSPWNPPNDFDHVAFTIFVQLPGREPGVSVMPLQNAIVPAGMRWHYRLRAHGWSNALFSSAGASAANEGTPTTPAAGIEVDAAGNTVNFTLSSRSLGGATSLSGAKLYITTWDYDGGYRPLQPTAAGSTFGGGDGASDPLVMDDTAVITLP